jgi:GntR family transcriptional regulator/MocR family aminotransferase
MRLAYLVVPPDLVDSFARALNELFREGQTLQQAVLARFLAEGHYASHIRRMRAVYGARHDALIAAIRHEFGDTLPVIGGDAGLHLVLGLPGRIDDQAVVQQGLRAGIATRPLSMYQMRKTKPARGLLLGYAAVPEEEIAPNFALLAKAVGSFL